MAVKSIRRYLGLTVSALGIAGCIDSAGNRVTMQEWWQANSGAQRGPSDRDQLAKSNERPRAPGAAADDRSNNTLAGGDSLSTPSGESVGPRGDVETVHLSGTNGDSAAGRSAALEAVRADVLEVDDETISVSDILEPIIAHLERDAQELPRSAYYERAAEVVRMQIVEAVAQHLLWRKAERHISEENEPQIEKAVDRMEKDRINREFAGRETAYEKHLAKHGESRTKIRERLRRAVLIDAYLRDRLLQLVPTPRRPELMAYYQAHRQEFVSPARREMFLIDVPIAAFLDFTKPVLPAHERDAKEKARRTIEQAAAKLAGGASFEEVARNHSQGLHSEEGGAWGFITRPSDGGSALQGRWAAPSRVLFELASGEVSDIIEDSKSYFMVKCGQVEDGKVLSFQDAQPRMVDALKQQRFLRLRADFLQSELDRSTIGSLDAFMGKVLDAIPPPRAGRAPTIP